MKFENDYIKVEIIKKELTEEQKELHRERRRKRRPYAITAAALAVAVLAVSLYGHFHRPQSEDAVAVVEDEQAETEAGLLADATYVTADYLATSTQAKYQDKDAFRRSFRDSIDELERDQAIVVHMEYDPYELEGVDDWRLMYGIYQDRELTEEIVASEYTWDAQSHTLTMAPPNRGINRIATSGLDTETVNRYSHSEYIVHDKGSGRDWGNLPTLYLACYYDEKTGEKLDEPEISIITMRAELEDTPVLGYSILEDGRPEFTWTSVEGASEYFICKVTYEEGKGYDSMMYPLGVTADNRWTTELPDYSDYAMANKEFRLYRLSEDQWKDESNYEDYKDEAAPGEVLYWNWGGENAENGICVIAVNEDGTSMISNVFLYSELAPNLPSMAATNTEKEKGFQREYESVEKFPAYDYITMCDGITNQKLIDYHTEEASVTPDRVIYVDEEGNYVSGETIDYLVVPYVVEGTPFSYTMKIPEYDEAGLSEDMKFLEDREEQLRRKSGEKGPEASTDIKEEGDAGTQIRQMEDVTIFANSALAEYLAANMLSGVTAVDVSGFPEAKDMSVVEDAFMEAYYQNPLILGVQGYQIDRKNMIVYVAYDDEATVQAEKQNEIQEKLTEIAGQIFQADMTDEEKELAINQYLCDTISYDEDALVNAEENDFLHVDEQYNDSFTAYGALLNGKCVCSGYAAAFKLLSDTAGLESIVVTGILDGGLSHAWNKIKLEDEWQIVDVTNNDMDYIPNALLNLPGFAGDRILVEDKLFMTDKLIAGYSGENEYKEYYHLMDRFFPVEEMAKQLAADLESKGEAVLRTDYDLDDERFYEITDAVYAIIGEDKSLYGYYWLGVIYLNTTRF